VVKGNSAKHMPGLGPAVPERCAETGAGFLMGGPFWADPIHDMDWVQGILALVRVSPAVSLRSSRFAAVLLLVKDPRVFS
jgi:tRNA (guanine26-N2/guanine27-N2)-dimethyltransferase